MKQTIAALGAAGVILIPIALAARPSGATVSPATSIVATGLNNPRGLTFGPAGNLYVAEGGTGGTLSTSELQCQQVPPPVGPYKGAFTASIARIGPQNSVTRIVQGLPSNVTAGGLMSGVADVAFVNGSLYALEAAAGCSHGLIGTSNEIIRVNAHGTTTPIANLSAFQQAHPVQHPEEDDFEPDGTWYSMVAVRGDLYAVEPNHGEVDRIDPATGVITRVVDVSATQGHIVPTAIAYKGNFFFGNLNVFPIVPGTSAIYKLTPGGQLQTWATGLTTVLGLVAGAHDELYALESMTGPGFPSPAQIGTGKVVQIDPNGRQTVIATGLSFASGMTMGPDGALYISNFGFGAPAGAGQIIRLTLN
jgi:hypothetical protein